MFVATVFTNELQIIIQTFFIGDITLNISDKLIKDTLITVTLRI